MEELGNKKINLNSNGKVSWHTGWFWNAHAYSTLHSHAFIIVVCSIMVNTNTTITSTVELFSKYAKTLADNSTYRFSVISMDLEYFKIVIDWQPYLFNVNILLVIVAVLTHTIMFFKKDMYYFLIASYVNKPCIKNKWFCKRSMRKTENSHLSQHFLLSGNSYQEILKNLIKKNSTAHVMCTSSCTNYSSQESL